ncbi:hypothetical protein HPB51_005355 [Rhipicephalus microplus]|uniref:Tick transposon n=1 Tax=Rhipicephalus microplus TaxID=6941 RepID=A0A9J6EX87_RHIMP|nr:hypothetical protein HPB51_005355 [Rhipicephalus microplus]
MATYSFRDDVHFNCGPRYCSDRFIAEEVAPLDNRDVQCLPLFIVSRPKGDLRRVLHRIEFMSGSVVHACSDFMCVPITCAPTARQYWFYNRNNSGSCVHKIESSLKHELATSEALDLKLLQADKEGGFVLAPTTVYKEKADAAVTENFQVANVKPSKVKATASKLCGEAGLQKLASSVRTARGVNLSVFFSAKTHKPEVPFRVIVSEQGTWQRLVGRYLQRSLSVLPVEDPCLIRKPQIVSEFLQQECPSEVSFFSVDVKDLYYSLPMDQVCAEYTAAPKHYATNNSINKCQKEPDVIRGFLNSATALSRTAATAIFFFEIVVATEMRRVELGRNTGLSLSQQMPSGALAAGERFAQRYQQRVCLSGPCKQLKSKMLLLEQIKPPRAA